MYLFKVHYDIWSWNYRNVMNIEYLWNTYSIKDIFYIMMFVNPSRLSAPDGYVMMKLLHVCFITDNKYSYFTPGECDTKHRYIFEHYDPG